MGARNQRSSLTVPAPKDERRSPGHEHDSGRRYDATERRQGFRAIGVAAAKLAAPIIGRRGGGILVRLKAEWAAVVGGESAAVTWPIALGRDGVLKLRTAPAAALELQHRAPLLIERVNLYFGRAVVTRLALVQGPLPLALEPCSAPPRPLGPAETAALDERLSGISDPELRAALARFGRAVIGAEVARDAETD